MQAHAELHHGFGAAGGNAAGVEAEAMLVSALGAGAPIGDDDVAREETRVRHVLGTAGQGNMQGVDALACVDLRHSYFPKGRGGPALCAVRGISLGLKRGECFGLLGPNGAGKTTTLGLLTGEIWPPDGGNVYVRGHNVATAAGGFFELLYGRLGNCLQVDAHWEDLSGREHLRFHGRLKGIPEAMLDAEVQVLLGRLGFTGADAGKKAKAYSGGMKRKLSVGIALIGRPELLLLDEPSACLDAAAKRYLWAMLRGRGAWQTALLTTHSMEEAEALCDRLAIQVSGQLRCLGSPIHIRHRYGKGYQLELFIAPGGGQTRVEALVRFVQERVAPGAVLLVSQPGRCLFELPPAEGRTGPMSLGAALSEVSASKRALGVTEYSLWQPSLEQVFLRFALEQREAGGYPASGP